MIKKYPTTLWGMVREVFASTALERQQERVAEATTLKARKRADAEFDRTMAHFYTERATALDPNISWWEFAAAKEKEREHNEDFRLNTEAAARAEARVEEQLVKLAALREKLK